MGNFFLIHARTVTGLEPLLAQELKDLGAQDIQLKNRVVICRGDLGTLYRANIFCRTAIRILRPLVGFAARDEKGFYKAVRAIDWSRWVRPTGTIAIDAHVRSSFTTHSLYLAQLAKDAIVDQFRDKTGQRPSVDLENPDLRIAINLFANEAQVLVDASGESLHKRGYRKKGGEAPLSETLAAGIIQLTDWDGQVPLLDPMCGSGTFLIEAAMIARNIAPGLYRQKFGFQRWQDFDRDMYERLIREAKQAVKNEVAVPIIGIDSDPRMVEIARGNIEHAGLQNYIRVERANFFEWNRAPQPAGVLVMNPPYDERIPVEDIAKQCEKIGDQFKRNYSGWNAYVLTGNPNSVKHFGLRSTRRMPLYNGGIECRLLHYEMGHAATVALRPVKIATPEAAAEHPTWKEKSEIFANRLRKNLKHLSKWAKREDVSAWRLYDKDIPELPFIVDLFGDRVHFAEVPRNYDHAPSEHDLFLGLMLKKTSEVLGIPLERIYLKKRKQQKADGFEFSAKNPGEFFEVSERGQKFLVNLSDYIEVGLYLEQRKIRALIEKEAEGKDFLNLYGYTGAASVFATKGGAKSTTTVDTAKTYLAWTEANLKLNGMEGANHQTVRSDAFEYLENEKRQFDLTLVDPPARAVNRETGESVDIQQEHPRLLALILHHTRPGGKVVFTTGYRTFQFDEARVRNGRDIDVQELTGQVVSPDFEGHANQRVWLITKN